MKSAMKAAVIVLLAIAPAAQADPSRSEITDEVTMWLAGKAGVPRSAVAFDDFGYKTFSDPTTGTGRISVGGSWHITANLYTVVEAPEVSEKDLGYISALTGVDVPVFSGPTAIQSYEAETPILFRAELMFTEHYDFFTFDIDGRTSAPKGVMLAPDDPGLLSKAEPQEQPEDIRATYRPISDATTSVDPTAVYRASIGSYTVTPPESGILVHRPNGECISATKADGSAAKVEAPPPVKAWEIVRIGAGSAGETLAIQIKPSC